MENLGEDRLRVTVKAFTKDFYSKDILVFDEKQTRMNDVKVKDSIDGIRIVPNDFPEAFFFSIVVARD